MALYFGALLSILVYNLLLGIAAGIGSYLCYAGFLISFCVFQLCYSGIGPMWLWSGLDPYLVDRSLLIAAQISCFLSHAFALRLVGSQARLRNVLNSYFNINLPIILIADFLLEICMLTFVLLVFSIIPLILSVLIYTVDSLTRREHVAYWFILAWGAFLLSVLATSLKTVGLLPPSLSTELALQIGSTIEFILLSIALASRIKGADQNLYNEKVRAANLALDPEREQLASENAQRLEVDLRFKMASLMAHRLNNPLHAIHIGSQLLEQSLDRLQKAVKALLGEELATDPEVRECQDGFYQIFAESLEPLAHMKEGVLRASESIQEIRR